jgi:hypothetical protein
MKLSDHKTIKVYKWWNIKFKNLMMKEMLSVSQEFLF